MKTSTYLKTIALAATMTVAAGAFAQRITESVTVEGRYTPDIIPADRLALLPAAINLTAPESPMAYDRKGVMASFAPDALSMVATGWRARKAYDTSKGYVDLRLGSWLNSTLSAGYAAISNEDTRLNVWLQHNSTSLWQAWKEDAEHGMRAADKRFRYDEAIGADLSQRFLDAGTLTADLRYHLGYFNYYGTDQGPEEDGHIKAPTQTLNDVYARVGWIGTEIGRFRYSIDADVRHFGYRAMYIPIFKDGYPREYLRAEGSRETAVNVGGNMRYCLSDNSSSVGLGLRYSGVLNSEDNDVNRLEAMPAYTLTGRNYTLRLGANLAVVGNGESTRFRVAPDVLFSYRKGMTAFSASVGGGTYLRTLAWMHEMDYYSDPGQWCYEAAYSPLDIRLALQLNPGGRWTLGVDGEWRTTIDETFGGFYQEFLNHDIMPSLSSSIYPSSSIYSYWNYPQKGNIKGFSIGVNAGYEFCRYLSLKAHATFQPQKGDKGILNGFDRPKLTCDLTAESNPIDRLSLRLDYHLRAKRQFGIGRLSRLDLSADYLVTDKVSVGVELDNLLNRHQTLLPGLALEGFSAMAGVQVVF